ncbi:MAG: serpin family protein [Gemmatimonadota bacterium]|jgi:serpin B
MKRSLAGSLARFLAVFLAVAACSDGTGPSEDYEPITRLPRELTAAETTLIGASNDFGLELVRTVAATDDRPNLILSPLSASMALGMTLNGADGATFDDMRSTLGFDGLTQEEINDSYRALVDLLTDLDPLVKFEIANAIWANEGVPFRDAFFQVVAAAFDATVDSRDFSDEATVDAINAWVDGKTHGLIDSIVDQLDPALVMLLVNAIYLDAAWADEFDPADTRPADFTRADGSTVTLDLMSRSDVELPVTWAPSYTAVELPYGGGAFSMIVILPAEGLTTRDVLAELDATAWDELVTGLWPRGLGRFALPKFTLSYDAWLNDALASMGMEVAFTPAADFTRMSPAGDRMCISFVRQKTFMEVDERGTRAAAVTAVGIVETSLPPEVVVDRPFVLVIRERLSGALLFAGLVGDPTTEDPGPEPPTIQCM